MLIFRFTLSFAIALAPVAVPAIASPSGRPLPTQSPSYWTPDRLQKAQPKVAPLRSETLSPLAPNTTPTPGSKVARAGRAPTLNPAPDVQAPLFTPGPMLPSPATSPNQVRPQAAGIAGASFTSSQLVPLAADLSYPYRAIGKLFFSDATGNNYVCSATVIAPRVILTAGHCVHSGNGQDSGLFTNFLFVPAFRDGFAPYGTWVGTYVSVTPDWRNGQGLVPNPADYAVIEVQNQVATGPDRIGDVTGWLGFATNSLAANHLTLLGYPCNFDQCAKIHQVTAQSFRDGGSNTVLYGSDMQGGSSGGPWIQNLGLRMDEQSAATSNQVVGVTSYGPLNPNINYQGSSGLDNRFLQILQDVCTRRADNC